MKKHMNRLAAIATTAIFASTSTDANATGFTNVTNNILASSQDTPKLILTVAYVAGLGFGVLGVLKLKGHVDSPQQVPLKDGLMRLAAGGALLAFPALLDAMQQTVGAGGTGIDAATMQGAVTGSMAFP